MSRPAPADSDPALEQGFDPTEEGQRVTVTQEKPAPSEDQDAEDDLAAGQDAEDALAWKRRLLGKTIDGRYAVERVLGEGGMGVVYLCRHTIIDKRVAMKVLRADLAGDTDISERFLNEARSASSIGNPHIIDISDFGRLPDGATYFIMEYLEGQPLSSVLARHEQLPPARLVHIARQLAEGLAAAHARGVVHRDLKPDNVFLIRRGAEDDFVKILDFGIAKVTSTSSRPTRAGQVFGTPHYMSPEQASGTAVDLRSDVYAFGVILYEMATGRLPFDADNFMAVLTQHMYRAPRRFKDLPDLRLPVPAQLEAIVFQCLAKSPDDRYQSMQELEEDLERFADGLEVRAVSPTARLRASSHSRWVNSILWTAAAALLLVLGALFFFEQSQPGPAVGAPDAETTPSSTPEGALPVAPPTPDAPAPLEARSAAQAPATVVLAVAPLEAHVFRDGADLGQSPLVLEVTDTPLALEARLDGYESQEIIVDGREPQLSVTLSRPAPPTKKAPITSAKKESAPAQPSAAPPAPSPAPAPVPAKKSGGSSEIVNPWD